jgi:hypothetical protein
MVVSLAGAWAARSKITSVEERILNITLILIADRRIRPLAEIYTDQRLDRAVENVVELVTLGKSCICQQPDAYKKGRIGPSGCKMCGCIGNRQINLRLR